MFLQVGATCDGFAGRANRRLPWFRAVLPAKAPTLWAASLFMAPYMVGDLVKLTAAAVLSRSLLPLLP